MRAFRTRKARKSTSSRTRLMVLIRRKLAALFLSRLAIPLLSKISNWPRRPSSERPYATTDQRRRLSPGMVRRKRMLADDKCRQAFGRTDVSGKQHINEQTITMKQTWHGHSAFRIEAGEARIWIDPFLSDNPFRNNG